MSLIIHQLGLQAYTDTHQAMQRFTAQRNADTADQIWLVEHPPVYSQGLNGDARHIQQNLDDIPLVHSDRGGQITYHGPGQLVLYVLIDLKRRKLGVRQLVTLLEQSTINLLQRYGLSAQARADAPGIYIDGKKIASLGLKIKRQCSYHGLALNVNMDLSPFQRITPCGLDGMKMCQLADFIEVINLSEVSAGLIAEFERQLANWPIISPSLNQ
jgi:lipoyl(octanoyl) transferase